MSHVDNLLKKGIAAAKAGQRAKARALLREVVRQRPNSVKGWLWLSASPEQGLCLCHRSRRWLGPAGSLPLFWSRLVLMSQPLPTSDKYLLSIPTCGKI